MFAVQALRRPEITVVSQLQLSEKWSTLSKRQNWMWRENGHWRRGTSRWISKLVSWKAESLRLSFVLTGAIFDRDLQQLLWLPGRLPSSGSSGYRCKAGRPCHALAGTSQSISETHIVIIVIDCVTHCHCNLAIAFALHHCIIASHHYIASLHCIITWHHYRFAFAFAICLNVDTFLVLVFTWRCVVHCRTLHCIAFPLRYIQFALLCMTLPCIASHCIKLHVLCNTSHCFALLTLHFHSLLCMT